MMLRDVVLVRESFLYPNDQMLDNGSLEWIHDSVPMVIGDVEIGHVYNIRREGKNILGDLYIEAPDIRLENYDVHIEIDDVFTEDLGNGKNIIVYATLRHVSLEHKNRLEVRFVGDIPNV